ncbi:hypothetical protein [uncultured Desulfovibrio sp.]|uniref:VgrG-related protein n=1 Tax=uncultured Desulfovibrio sp. TaxID=167968 RepID=UPI0026141C60|nr:hypothetical protein [uncultured Desulfovibrio sp.]
MSRLQQYRRQTGATTLNTPGAVRITAPPQGADRAARELLTSLQGAIQQTGKVLAREHVLTQQTRMDESLLAARQEFSEWQAAYMQEHQGGNALEAGKDFREKFAEIAGRHLEAFDGAENEVFRGLLGGRLAAEGLRASEQGLSYAARQKAVWEEGVRKGRLAMLEQDAYSDPENGAWLDTQRAAILQDAEARGQDVTALNRSLTSAVQLARIRGLADRGDLDGASRLLAGSVPGAEGDFSARYESGTAGSAAIGYDKTGGTSYGKWQLSSKQGSLEGFLRYLDAQGGAAAATAARLRAAGPADTGSRQGAMPEAWKKEAQANAEFERWQREYVRGTFYEPAAQSLPGGAAALASASPAVREMIWSTAVQHGAAGATDIFKKVWRDGMTDADFIRATYADRATRFGGSDPEVRASVQRRLAEEGERLAAGSFGTMLTPADATAARNLLERERAKLDAADRKRKELARTAAAGFPDAAAWGAAGGDFSAAASIVEEVEGLDPEAGRKLRARLTARQTAHDVMQLNADRPLLEQRDAAMKALDAHMTPTDARDALSLKADAESVIRQRLKLYKEDPAAFAAGARPELLRDDMTPEERTRRLLEAQSVLGKGLNVAPRVLTKAQAADMERAFAESDPQTRLQLLTTLRAGYGPYFTAAATEAKLPAPVVALGSTLDHLPPSKAAVLLSAATAKDSDIPGVDKDARATARDAVAGLSFMQQLTAASRRFPGNEAARALAASWEKMLTNASLLGVEPDEATKHFEISVEADPDEGGGHMLLLPKGSLPDGWDADDLAEAAKAAREVVRQRLTDALPKEGTPLQRSMLERGARHVAESGVWLSAADGGSVHLVDEVTGLPVTYPDGAPVAFSLKELAAIAADRQRTTTEGIAGLYNRLFGEGADGLVR